MYDDEEEIRRKRRNLIIAIAAIVGLIILLIILLVIGSSKKKTTKAITPQCELIVKSDTPTNKNGAYTGPIEIGLDESKTKVTSGLKVQEARVGIQESQRNGATYKLSKSGTTKVYGYVRDTKGNLGTCEKEFTIESARPNCELEVKSGTLGQDGWYTSDVVVAFKSKTVEGGTIEKWSIEEVKRDFKTDEILNRAGEGEEANSDTYTVKNDGEIEVIGTVIDNNNVDSTCMLKIKKDSTKPTCTLEVRSGTKGNNGNYSSDVVVGFEKAEDAASGLAGKGVGVKEDYEAETYTVKSDGKTKVNGYVKDKAGNTNTCSMDIVRGEGSGESSANAACELQVKGNPQGSNYTGTVVVSFKSKTASADATVEAFGLATSAQLNGAETLNVNALGNHTIYGMVKDSSGKYAECRTSFTIEKKIEEKQSTPSCSLYVDGSSNGSGGYYPTVTVKFGSYSSTNDAKIVAYGIATSAQLSGNNTLSVSNVGSHTIYGMVKDSYGHTATCSTSFTLTTKPSTPTEPETPSSTRTLATQTLKAGDIVNYNKNSKSIVCGHTYDKAGASGWEVFKVTNSGVELITRGVPECYTKSSSEKSTTSISNMNAKAQNYLDSSYASAARMMNYNDARIYGSDKDAAASSKRNVGVVYWLATKANKDTTLWAVRNNASSALAGQIFEGNLQTYGMRPIVTLKSTVYVEKTSNGSYNLFTGAKGAEDITTDSSNSMYDKLVEIVNSTLLADFEIE